MELQKLSFFVGGEHDGDLLGIHVGHLITVGSRVEPWVWGPAHDNDGHTFDALRIAVNERGHPDNILAEILTEGGVVSC